MKVDIAVVQMDCVPGDVAANLAHIEQLVGEAARRLAERDHAAERLIVLPECATTGYFVGDRASELAEPADGPNNARLAALSASVGSHLAVGVIEADGDDVYDALALISPSEGLLASYRKVHLFSGEKAVFSVGSEPCLVETAFGRVGLTICYDLCSRSTCAGWCCRELT